MPLHIQRLTNARIPAHAPNLRIEIVVDECVTPQKRNAQLDQERLISDAGVGVLETNVTEKLPGTLVDDPEQYSEADVISDVTTDE